MTLFVVILSAVAAGFAAGGAIFMLADGAWNGGGRGLVLVCMSAFVLMLIQSIAWGLL